MMMLNKHRWQHLEHDAKVLSSATNILDVDLFEDVIVQFYVLQELP